MPNETNVKLPVLKLKNEYFKNFSGFANFKCSHLHCCQMSMNSLFRSAFRHRHCVQKSAVEVEKEDRQSERERSRKQKNELGSILQKLFLL